MENKEVISVLNDLIETSKDGEKGFQECAENINNVQLKNLFMHSAQECTAAASDLQQLVRDLGGEPETTSSVVGALHRGWVDLKGTLTGEDEEAILTECERGEAVAMKSYKNALEKPLPDSIRMVIKAQMQGVQANHDQIKSLRNVARANGDSAT